MSETRTCDCYGNPAPGAMCGWIVVGNKNLCGYKGDEFCEHMGRGCRECGATSQDDAQGKCSCGGDKDDCHGCHIWPDEE